MDREGLLVGPLAGKDFKGRFEVVPASVSSAHVRRDFQETYLTRLAGGGLSAMLAAPAGCG